MQKRRALLKLWRCVDSGRRKLSAMVIEVRKDGSIAIQQQILVERVNHRAMVLGKQGARIKAIGSAAREEMAAQLGCKVHLFLDVKVDERWQDKPDYYRMFGM